MKAKKPVIVSLIKSGAFDSFGPREEIMRQYIWKICEPKKRITLQNFNGLNERDLLPDELSFQRRLFVFNKALKKNCKVGDYLRVENNYYDFYQEFFDIDRLTTLTDGSLAIEEKAWKKMYDAGMDPARDYFKVHKDELLESLNQALFQEMWDKYAEGELADWEMDSLGFYYHEHPLAKVQKSTYGIVEYDDLPDVPPVDYTFKRNGVNIPIFKTTRVCGTVIAKDDTKSQISIITPASGVVTVKMNRDYYAKYKMQISEIQIDGTKKVRERGWFRRGEQVLCNGFKRSGMFFLKSYKRTKSHQLYRISQINEDGTIEITNKRWGE